jgi:hypothetical protein
MSPEIATEELTAILDRVAEEVLARADVVAPPVNAIQLAVRLGFQVAWDERQAGRARIVRSARAGQPGPVAILLKPEPRLERQQWAVAHELGEAWAWRVFEWLGQDPRALRPAVREQVANWLASRLLLPARWFLDSGQEWDWDLFRLKQRFSTASHELIARRMLDCGPPAVVTIFDQGLIVFRQGPGNTRPPRWADWEEACRQEAIVEARPNQRRGPPRVRVWPVHEPNWLREIARTEYGEDFA